MNLIAMNDKDEIYEDPESTEVDESEDTDDTGASVEAAVKQEEEIVTMEAAAVNDGDGDGVNTFAAAVVVKDEAVNAKCVGVEAVKGGIMVKGSTANATAKGRVLMKEEHVEGYKTREVLGAKILRRSERLKKMPHGLDIKALNFKTHPTCALSLPPSVRSPSPPPRVCGLPPPVCAVSLPPRVRSPSPRVCALPPPVCALSLLPCVRSPSSRVCALPPPVCALSLPPCVRSPSSRVCALSPPVCALSLLPCVRSLSSRVCALSPPMCALSLLPCVRSLSSHVCALSPPVCALSLLPCVRSPSSRVCALSPPVCALSLLPYVRSLSSRVCALLFPSGRLADAETVLVGWTYSRWSPEIATSPPVCALSPFPLSVPPGRQDGAGGLEVIPLRGQHGGGGLENFPLESLLLTLPPPMMCALSPHVCPLPPCVPSPPMCALSPHVCPLPPCVPFPPMCALFSPSRSSLSGRQDGAGGVEDAKTVLVGWRYSRWSPRVRTWQPFPRMCVLFPTPLKPPPPLSPPLPGRQDGGGGVEVHPLEPQSAHMASPSCPHSLLALNSSHFSLSPPSHLSSLLPTSPTLPFPYTPSSLFPHAHTLS
ncbi:unnamed protein product [Closterium sp. Naga37s-1]|nr:unnamed protein product [Closterium sp. Naga37s-1]